MSKNLCPNCGKKRILAKTWQEKVFLYGKVSVIEHREMICPDKNCQKKIEKETEMREEKSRQIKKDKEERDSAHRSKMVNLRFGRAKKEPFN